MSGSKNFEQDDRQAARNFAVAAKKAGVRRIIYLGGLGDDADPKLSPHLRSRHEVGEILRESAAQVIEFRAGMIVGAGSLSFDLLKSLTDRLPVMICPKWLTTPTQPIAVDDVLAYLLAANELPAGQSRIFEIGGTDVVTYSDLIREYAWLLALFDRMRVEDKDFRDTFREELRKATNGDLGAETRTDAELKKRHSEVMRHQDQLLNLRPYGQKSRLTCNC